MLTRFEIALVLSHRRAWRQFLRTGQARCVILEDDVHFGEEFAEFIRNSDLEKCDFDVIKLETFRRPLIVSQRDSYMIDGRRVARLLSTHMGSAGYTVTRRAAQRLLTLSAGVPLGMDSILFDFDRMSASGLEPLRIGQVIPAPIIQHDLLRDAQPEDLQLASLIGDKRGRRLGHGPATVGKIIREAARPFRRLWFKMRSRTVEYR